MTAERPLDVRGVARRVESHRETCHGEHPLDADSPRKASCRTGLNHSWLVTRWDGSDGEGKSDPQYRVPLDMRLGDSGPNPRGKSIESFAIRAVPTMRLLPY